MQSPQADAPARALAVDRLLRFRPKIDERYELQHAAARVQHLRRAFVVGLVTYNAYSLDDLLLLPDVLWLAIPFHVLVVSPAVLLLIFVLPRVAPAGREALVLFATVSVFLLTLICSWLSQAPLAPFSYAEFTLFLMFANMLCPLRFRHALVFTVACGGATILALLSKPGLEPAVVTALAFQLVTASLFTLYANFHVERRRCLDYLGIVAAERRAKTAQSLTKRFEDLSTTDPLTGLPNRRVLDKRVDEWLADGGLSAVLMIDVDHFKLFNDTLGHPAGDDCLRTVGHAMQRLAGPGILCARFGGEEFSILLHRRTELEAVRLAKALVSGIEALAIGHPGRNDGHGVVTVSAGIAMARPGITRAGIFAAADPALYEAKRAGRNRWLLDSRPPSVAEMVAS